MFKTIRDMFLGAFVAAAVGAAHAVIGQVPVPGFQTIDGGWLLGLSGGTNLTYQFGITAAGTTQATATQLNAGIALVEVDTAAASTGVALPACVAGTVVQVYNNGLQTLTIYPQIANNPLTGAQDTINNGATLSGGLATHTQISFACAKNGVWGAS